MNVQEILRPRTGKITAVGALKTARQATMPVSRKRREITGLYTFDTSLLWEQAVGLADDICDAWPTDPAVPAHPANRAAVLAAANRLKYGLGAAGALTEYYPPPAWPHFDEGFQNFCLPAALMPERAALEHALMCFANAAVDLSGAAKDETVASAAIISRGTRELLGGLASLEVITSDNPDIAAGTPPADIVRRTEARAKLGDVCEAWPAVVVRRERVVSRGGFYAIR